MLVSRYVTFCEQESGLNHEVSENPNFDVDLGLEKESYSQPACVVDSVTIETFVVDHASQKNVNATEFDEETLPSDVKMHPSRSTGAKKLPSSWWKDSTDFLPILAMNY